MKKNEQEQSENQQPSTTQEGANKLRLSVTRMKKLRASVKAGASDHPGSSITWNHVEIELDRSRDQRQLSTEEVCKGGRARSSGPGDWLRGRPKHKGYPALGALRRTDRSSA